VTDDMKAAGHTGRCRTEPNGVHVWSSRQCKMHAHANEMYLKHCLTLIPLLYGKEVQSVMPVYRSTFSYQSTYVYRTHISMHRKICMPQESICTTLHTSNCHIYCTNIAVVLLTCCYCVTFRCEANYITMSTFPSHMRVWYSTVQCGTVWYSTIQSGTVQYSVVQYSTVWYSTVQYGTVQCGTVWYSTVQYSVVQYGTVQYGTVQYGTVQYGTVQYGTVQYR